MSYGSLSAKAIESLNKGALIAGCYHNTGEGSLSPYHQNGADVMLNIGTAYFGVRELNGRFSMEKLKQKVKPCEQLTDEKKKKKCCKWKEISLLMIREKN